MYIYDSLSTTSLNIKTKIRLKLEVLILGVSSIFLVSITLFAQVLTFFLAYLYLFIDLSNIVWSSDPRQAVMPCFLDPPGRQAITEWY